MRKTDAAARRFADRERDRIAYPLPLVMPVAEADRWYRGGISSPIMSRTRCSWSCRAGSAPTGPDPVAVGRGLRPGRPGHWHGQCLALYVICDDGRRLYTGGCSFDGWSCPRTYALARQTLQALEVEHRSRGGWEAAASDEPPESRPAS